MLDTHPNYRDIHEYHDPCYYCKHRKAAKERAMHSPFPLKVCDGCPGGLEGAEVEAGEVSDE